MEGPMRCAMQPRLQSGSEAAACMAISLGDLDTLQRVHEVDRCGTTHCYSLVPCNIHAGQHVDTKGKNAWTARSGKRNGKPGCPRLAPVTRSSIGNCSARSPYAFALSCGVAWRVREPPVRKSR